MNPKVTERRRVLAAITLLPLALVQAPAALARESKKWRLQVSGKAKSGGVTSLRITDHDGQVWNVDCAVEDGTGENAVARTIRDCLKENLPQDHFHLEVDDGEDVLIKRRFGTNKFDFEVVDNTVEHVRLNLDRE